MTENYVKLSDIASSLFKCEYTIGPDPCCTGRIVPNNWLADLPVVEIDPDKTTNTVEPCIFYRTTQILNYGEDGIPEVNTVSYCQREKDQGRDGTACYCKGRKIACSYSAKTRMEGIMTEMSPDEKERAYWIRTHMTAISRYLKNEKPVHAEKYKKLALEAAQAILRIVNGGINGEET